MTVLMLGAFAYQLTGNLIHEVVGIIIFALFIAHNLMNRNWYKNLPHGKHSTRRVLSMTVNLLLLAIMVLLAISSVMISRDLFAFLDIHGGFTARQIHTLASYWGLILLSVHLGMHWNMVWGMVQKATGIANANRIWISALRILSFLIAVYGIKASFDMNIGSKLILYDTFSYWNFEESTIAFFINNLSIMGLYVCITYYVLKWIGNIRKTKNKLHETTNDLQNTI